MLTEDYIETQKEEKIFSAKNINEIKQIADSIMEVMCTTRENALKAAIKIKSKELDIDLTPLLDLLK